MFKVLFLSDHLSIFSYNLSIYFSYLYFSILLIRNDVGLSLEHINKMNC